jgi:hypothetical protein
MIRLRCHEKDYKFQPKLTDVDLVPGSISSNNPSVAQGHPGRVGFGTAGDIAIDAEGVTGDATITYQVEDKSTGARTTIKVEVHVYCPPTGTPTHRPPACEACRKASEDLNKAIDAFAAAQASKANDETLERLEAEVKRLTRALDECEKDCGPKKG